MTTTEPSAGAEGRYVGALGWTMGACWLRCGRTDVRVRWIGPAILSGPHGVLKPDLFACEDCIERCYAQALEDRTARR